MEPKGDYEEANERVGNIQRGFLVEMWDREMRESYWVRCLGKIKGVTVDMGESKAFWQDYHEEGGVKSEIKAFLYYLEYPNTFFCYMTEKRAGMLLSDDKLHGRFKRH